MTGFPESFSSSIPAKSLVRNTQLSRAPWAPRVHQPGVLDIPSQSESSVRVSLLRLICLWKFSCEPTSNFFLRFPSCSSSRMLCRKTTDQYVLSFFLNVLLLLLSNPTPAFSGRRCRGCASRDRLCRWIAAERQGVLCRAARPGPRSCRLIAFQNVPLQRFVRLRCLVHLSIMTLQ